MLKATLDPRETPGAQTLRRGLAVLKLLARVGPSGLRMGDIGRRLGLNKTTAVRLTQALLEEKFLSHDPVTRSYRLGPEAFAVGLAAEPSYSLQRLCAPLLRALALESGDSVFFSVPHGFEAICLSRDEGDFPVRNQTLKAGDRHPLGVGAGSLAMLAALPDAEVEAALAHNAEDIARRFPRSDVAVIRRLVAETRVQGYSLIPGLVTEGNWALGVATLDPLGRPVAAVSLGAIEARMALARRLTLVARLRHVSQSLTAAMAAGAAD
jgi:DNA-binding IclR family transcriptional regulator